MTSGLNMQRARHTVATDLRRAADLGAASQALGQRPLDNGLDLRPLRPEPPTGPLARRRCRAQRPA
jgi:hypothetical protein